MEDQNSSTQLRASGAILLEIFLAGFVIDLEFRSKTTPLIFRMTVSKQ